MNFFRILREMLRPGNPEFQAHLTRATEEQARLLRCLHRLDDPVTREVNVSTNEAAEF